MAQAQAWSPKEDPDHLYHSSDNFYKSDNLFKPFSIDSSMARATKRASQEQLLSRGERLFVFF
jgi:hypothetical protein